MKSLNRCRSHEKRLKALEDYKPSPHHNGAIKCSCDVEPQKKFIATNSVSLGQSLPIANVGPHEKGLAAYRGVILSLLLRKICAN